MSPGRRTGHGGHSDETTPTILATWSRPRADGHLAPCGAGRGAAGDRARRKPSGCRGAGAGRTDPRTRGTGPGEDRQRRHGLDAHLRCPRAHDDGPRAGLVLWGNGSAAQRAGDHHAELHPDGRNQYPVGSLGVQRRFRTRLSRHHRKLGVDRSHGGSAWSRTRITRPPSPIRRS